MVVDSDLNIREIELAHRCNRAGSSVLKLGEYEHG